MDLQTTLVQVVQWYKDAQYEAIVQLLEIIIESSNGFVKDLEQTSSTKELATQHIKASLFTYFGDSLYQLKYFRRALRAYDQALLFNDTGSRRASKRCKTSSSSINNNCDTTKTISNSNRSNDSELKHRIHRCHLEMHESKEAKATLERIPAGDRTNKLNAALADLYYSERNFDKSKELYIEILKHDPLRLDIVMKICKMGNCDPNDILTQIPDETKRNYSWYPGWVQAQCYLHSPNSKQAIKLFETLTSRFERRASILTSLAEAHYYDGNFREAVRIFQIAYQSDPLTLAGVGSFAACLHKEGSKRTLEDLAVTMSLRCNVEGEYFPEPWLALAHYYASNDKKEPKALLFVQKAYKLNRYSIEVLILLACLCLEKRDSSKAIPYIVTAQTHAPYRYEVQRILCDAFLANNKKVAALNFAKAGIKSLGETARSYYLWADIMLKSSDKRREKSARTCLDKAVKLDNTYLPAVFAYVDLLIEDKAFDYAIQILNNAYPHHNMNTQLHQYLSTCYAEKKENDKALFHGNLVSELTVYKHRHEPPHRIQQDHASSQEEVDQMLGLEADELVDHGDSEADEANLDMV